MFRHQILGLLRDGDARHGYALAREYTRRTGVETNSGYAYRDLQKLVEEGLVKIVANKKGADRRRRPYCITEAGRRCFDEWFSAVPHVNLGSDGELAARAIFFDEVDVDRVVQVLDSWRHDLWVLSRQIDRQMEVPRSTGALGAASGVILHRRKMLAALELTFLDDLRTAYESEGHEATKSADASDAPPPPVRMPLVPKAVGRG